MPTRLLLAIAAVTCLAACGQETRVVRDNSAESQFANIFSNRSDWQVDGRGAKKPGAPPKPAFKPVENAKAPVDNSAFANVKFSTSFQTDEPQSDTTTPPGADPWLTNPGPPAPAPATPAGGTPPSSPPAAH